LNACFHFTCSSLTPRGGVPVRYFERERRQTPMFAKAFPFPRERRGEGNVSSRRSASTIRCAPLTIDPREPRLSPPPSQFEPLSFDFLSAISFARAPPSLTYRCLNCRVLRNSTCTIQPAAPFLISGFSAFGSTFFAGLAALPLHHPVFRDSRLACHWLAFSETGS